MKTSLIRSALVGSAAIALAISGSALGNPPTGAWGVPINAEKLPGSSSDVNTGAIDGCVSLSRDGLEIYYTSFRDGSADLFVARRDNTSQGFGAPSKLPSTINTGANEACPTIIGRNTLHFLRSEGSDAGNLFVSKRTSGDWQTAKPFNPIYNTPGLEEAVNIFEDAQGREVVIFSRRNPDGSGGVILQSVAGALPEPVKGGPNAEGSNNRPWVSRDGLHMAFDSTRAGGQGGNDIWFADRATTDSPFGAAYTIPELNSPLSELRPWISWDGTEIYFSSNRTGSESPAPDVWTAQRARLRGPKSVSFPAPSGD